MKDGSFIDMNAEFQTKRMMDIKSVQHLVRLVPMANFIKIHEHVTELWEKSYYFWITPRRYRVRMSTHTTLAKGALPTIVSKLTSGIEVWREFLTPGSQGKYFNFSEQDLQKF